MGGLWGAGAGRSPAPAPHNPPIFPFAFSSGTADGRLSKGRLSRTRGVLGGAVYVWVRVCATSKRPARIQTRPT